MDRQKQIGKRKNWGTHLGRGFRSSTNYVIVGGFAVIRHGYIRATGDIDLLVENSPENIDRIRQALAYLPDGESHNIADNDLDEYRVVRVSGEITVDLLGKACDVTYSSAQHHIQYDEIDGIKIPYLKPALLIKTKMSVRPPKIFRTATFSSGL